MPSVVDGTNVVSAGARLRRLMSELDQQAYLLEADYSALGEVTAAEAARAKGALCSAADGVYALLRSLERTPEYKKALKDSK